MVRISMAAVVLLALAASPVLAQTPPPPNSPNPNAAVTGMKPDRTTADTATRAAMKAKEGELRKKRTDCRAKAKAEKVALVKRPAYVKTCMGQ